MDKTNIHALTDAITASYREFPDIIKIDSGANVSPEVVISCADDLLTLIFPGFRDNRKLDFDTAKYRVGEISERLLYNLRKQISRALIIGEVSSREDAPGIAEETAYKFLETIPRIRALAAGDADAALDGDPAAFSKSEVVLCYPGLFAVTVSRLAHELYLMKVPFIPRIMTEYAHNVTGIDIHPGASIGHHFFIDHGTGVVIGETTTIGNHVKIYQGVTLGALSTRGGQKLAGVKRHPTIEDRVTIYAGASILGGETIIGAGTVVGSNAFITKSVSPDTRVSVKNPELQFTVRE